MRNFQPYDVLGIVLIAMIFVLVMIRIDIFPIYIDIYYHLAIMRSFDIVGGIALHDFIQFAPFGRPHIYPPFFHILLYVPYKLGIGPESLAKVSSALIFPSILFTSWYTIKKIFSPRVGLLTTLILASSFPFFFMSSMYCASMVSTVLFLWCMLFLYEKKTVSSIVLMSMSLYSHPSCPHMFSATLLIWALLDEERRNMILKALGAAYILFLPWGMSILLRAGSFRELGTHSYLPEVYIIAALLGVIGAYLSIRKAIYEKKRVYVLPLSLLMLFLPVHYFYGSRAFVHYFIPLSMLCAIAIDGAMAKCIDAHEGGRGLKVLAALLVIIVAASSCSLVLIPNKDDKFQATAESTLKVLITGSMGASSIYGYDNELIDQILAHTDADDIIYVENRIVGTYISGLTGRATTSGIFMEVEPDDEYELGGPFGAFVYNDPEDPRISGNSAVFITEKHVLEIIDDNNITKVATPKRNLPIALAIAMILISIIALLNDNKIHKK